MPPFGAEWFQHIAEGTLVGVLREEWIYHNLGLDHVEDMETRKSEIELQGFYNNPEFYFLVKESEGNQQVRSNTPFKVEYDTSAFTDRLGKAQAGEVVINDMPELAARIASKRTEIEKRLEEEALNDPRIVAPFGVRADPGDELEIEDFHAPGKDE